RHHEHDRGNALIRQRDKCVDVGIARSGRGKSGRSDVDHADLLTVLDQTAHQTAELCLVIDAAEFRRDGWIVLEHNTARGYLQMAVQTQRAFGAADHPRQLIAEDPANESAVDERTIDSVHRSKSYELTWSRSVGESHRKQRHH